jgi:hypothetical protein
LLASPYVHLGHALILSKIVDRISVDQTLIQGIVGLGLNLGNEDPKLCFSALGNEHMALEFFSYRVHSHDKILEILAYLMVEMNGHGRLPFISNFGCLSVAS